MENNLENNNLPFRPLDNSMSTQTKYELEAKHWYNAQRSVISRSTGNNGSFIGLIVGVALFLVGALAFIMSLFNLIIMLISDSYRVWKEGRDHDLKHKRYLDKLDGIIQSSPPVRGHDTPDSEYEND